jgi:uncharacterized membrane protein YgcG
MSNQNKTSTISTTEIAIASMIGLIFMVLFGMIFLHGQGSNDQSSDQQQKQQQQENTKDNMVYHQKSASFKKATNQSNDSQIQLISDTTTTQNQQEQYVYDDAKVLRENTSIMVNGLNVKYAGFQSPVAIAVITSTSDLGNTTIEDYAAKTVKDKNLPNNTIAIVVDTTGHQYAVNVGSEVPSSLSDAVSSDYLNGTQAMNLMAKDDWDTGIKTAVAITDNIIIQALYGSLSINKTVAPMSADELNAQADLQRAKKDSSEASTRSYQAITSTIISGIGLATLIVVVLILLTIRIKYANKMKDKERLETIDLTLDSAGFYENPGLQGDARQSIIRTVFSSMASSGSKQSVFDIAQKSYEHDVLPVELIREDKRHSKSDYVEFINDAQRKDGSYLTWWTDHRIDVSSIAKEAESFFTTIGMQSSAFQDVYSTFRSLHPEIVHHEDFHEDQYQYDLLSEADWRDHIQGPRDQAITWMMQIFSKNGGLRHYTEKTVQPSYSLDDANDDLNNTFTVDNDLGFSTKVDLGLDDRNA